MARGRGILRGSAIRSSRSIFPPHPKEGGIQVSTENGCGVCVVVAVRLNESKIKEKWVRVRCLRVVGDETSSGQLSWTRKLMWPTSGNSKSTTIVLASETLYLAGYPYLTVVQ